MSQPVREHQFSAAFVAVVDALVDDFDVVDLLDQLNGHCVALLDVDAAAVLVADPVGELRPVVASTNDTLFMELLQRQADDGPCMDSYRTRAQVRVPDLALVPEQWPGFAAAARACGFASVHAIPLRLREDAIGALGLYHRAPGPLPAEDLALAQALADMATIGIMRGNAVQRVEVLTTQLQTALNNRGIIEQAKGALSQRLGITVEVAHQHLRDHARGNNLHLADSARRFIDGELHLDPPNPGSTSAVGTSGRSPSAGDRQ